MPTDVVIARVLTAMSPGAIAVIELQGNRAADLLRSVTQGRTNNRELDLVDGRLVLCRIIEAGQTLDDAIAVVWAGGAMAELQLHGGVRIVERVMQLLLRAGATAFHPGVGAPAIDWVEREVDAALMTAQTRHMTRWLLSQRQLLPDLIRAAPPPLGDPELVRRARAAAPLVRGLTVAIIGPANAGKSTLANRLIGHERVITSDVPGTTRDWVSEIASIRGWPITLTDTAGIRATADPIEQEAIRRGVKVARAADLVLVVLDASRSDAERSTDLASVNHSLPPDRPHLLVYNKSDLRPTISDDAIVISALTGAGRESLELAIASRLGLDTLNDHSPAPFTARQWNALGLADADRA